MDKQVTPNSIFVLSRVILLDHGGTIDCANRVFESTLWFSVIILGQKCSYNYRTFYVVMLPWLCRNCYHVQLVCN